MTEGNGHLDRLFVQLDGRLSRIESALDRIAEQHDEHAEKLGARISALELRQAEQLGGWRVLTILGAIAGVFGGFIQYVLRHWLSS